MKLKLIILFCICSFIACNKQTSFYRIEFYNKNGYSETFVVSNPPKDTLKLKEAIEKYNVETLSIDTIKKYKGCGRIFFRGTELLTRNFEYDKPYNKKAKGYDQWLYTHQDLAYHTDDELMSVMYDIYPDGKVAYIYVYGYAGDWHKQYINLDSFYNAKKKEYGIK